MPKQWFVGVTQQGREFVARANLEREYKLGLLGKSFENYLPLCVSEWAKFPRIKPFLPSYIFLSLNPGNEPWRAILSTLGMRSVLTSGERPSPIPDWIIEDIKAREKDGMVQLPAQIRCKFKKGDMVSIKGSPMDAMFHEVDGNRRAEVFIQLLGRTNRLIVPLSKLSSSPLAGSAVA